MPPLPCPGAQSIQAASRLEQKFNRVEVGFKLHLIPNDPSQLLAFKLSAGNTDERQPVPEMTQELVGQLFSDKGYISQKLFEELYEGGLQRVTKAKKTMKTRLVKRVDKILLRKRPLIETVNDPLKNIG